MHNQTVSSKRFGMIAVEKKYVTPEQVMTALQIQVDENMSKGIHRQIGAILFDNGQMNPGQIQIVLGELTSAAKLAV